MFLYFLIIQKITFLIIAYVAILFQGIFSFIFNFVELIFSQQNLSELLQGSSIAVITIFISFAIPLFSEAFKLKDDEGSLDLHVALDYVWEFKKTLLYFLVSLLIPIFIKELNIISIITFVIWVFAFIKLIKTTLRAYSWAKGNKNDYRLRYLNTDIEDKDIIPVWKSFLSEDRQLNFPDEERFFTIFSKKISTLIKSNKEEDFNVLNKLLNEFSIHINHRNIQFLYYSEYCIRNIIDWHYSIWHKNYSSNVRNTDLYLAEDHLERIFLFLQKEVFKKDSKIQPLFFIDKLDQFEKYQDVIVENGDQEIPYIYHMPLRPVEFFNNSVDSSYQRDIWDSSFPEHWKVTIKSWKGDSHQMVRFWLQGFMYWLEDVNERQDLKWKIDTVIKGFFPNVELYLWSGILRLALFKPASTETFKYLIEKEVIFGKVGRVYTGIYSIDDKDGIERDYKKRSDAQKENSYKLALEIFHFNKKNIIFWLDLVKQIEYSRDSEYFYDRNSFEDLLKEFLRRLDEREDIK